MAEKNIDIHVVYVLDEPTPGVLPETDRPFGNAPNRHNMPPVLIPHRIGSVATAPHEETGFGALVKEMPLPIQPTAVIHEDLRRTG